MSEPTSQQRGVAQWEFGCQESDSQTSLIVLMCNDCVIGVYTDEEKAEAASKTFLEKIQQSHSYPGYIWNGRDSSKIPAEEVRQIKADYIRQVFYIHSTQAKVNAEAKV